MPVEWRWYNDQHTIICFTFQDPWTLDEFVIADTEAGYAIEDFDQKVDAIMDVSQAHLVPRNIVSGMVSMAKRNDFMPNAGASIVIHANRLVETLVRVVLRLVPEDTAFIAKDFADAERIIETLQNKRSNQ